LSGAPTAAAPENGEADVPESVETKAAETAAAVQDGGQEQA